MRLSLSALLLLLATGCPGPSDDSTVKDDLDGDGWSTDQGDCNDDDDTVYPGADETWYDTIDQDCDGNDDDQDLDGVGFSAGDCDDLDASAYPGATETCDEADNDCDGEIDEDAVDSANGFADDDGDGFGNEESPVVYCGELPEGVAGVSGDCDDTDDTISPSAEEFCDGLDNDCDGDIDEDLPDPATWYGDADGDGYGDVLITTQSCVQPEGYVATGDDCDDNDPETHPGALEDCAEVDRDCDGDPTAGAIDGGTWYADADGDTYGDEASAVLACEQPADTIGVGGDCDDAAADIHPGATETCDGFDQDCDGSIDNGASDAGTWYTDDDSDGFGGDVGTVSCEAPPGSSAETGDCDDGDATVNPAATETCDGVDQDCNGAVDDGATDGTSFYADTDGDAYGDDATLTVACAADPGWIEVGGDCDDTSASAYPGATEVCDGDDNNCDGTADEAGAVGEVDWYLDSDSDGYGGLWTPVHACDAPAANYATNNDDCDDGRASVYPGAAELCDLIDNDCDSVVDDGATGSGTWYSDLDNDGFGDPATGEVGCSDGSTVSNDLDCDDTDDAINPWAIERCDGVDENCSGDVDDEAGTALFVSTAGVEMDATAALTGSATAPVEVGDSSAYDLVVDSGTLYLCDGKWYIKTVMATSGNSLSIVGRNGAALTTLSSGGTTHATKGSIVSATNTTVSVQGVTITEGIGSSGTNGGAIAASQTVGSAVPATPNVTLEDCVVTGNVTSYGGAIAVYNYGWVSLVDTVVYGNSGSVAGGGAWIQNRGAISCEATTLGGAGIYDNDSPIGGGVYFSYASGGALDSLGCDWGDDPSGDDNSVYDVQVSSTANKYCYTNASVLTEALSCSGGKCTSSTDGTCP